MTLGGFQKNFNIPDLHDSTIAITCNSRAGMFILLLRDRNQIFQS